MPKTIKQFYEENKGKELLSEEHFFTAQVRTTIDQINSRMTARILRAGPKYTVITFKVDTELRMNYYRAVYTKLLDNPNYSIAAKATKIENTPSYELTIHWASKHRQSAEVEKE